MDKKKRPPSAAGGPEAKLPRAVTPPLTESESEEELDPAPGASAKPAKAGAKRGPKPKARPFRTFEHEPAIVAAKPPGGRGRPFGPLVQRRQNQRERKKEGLPKRPAGRPKKIVQRDDADNIVQGIEIPPDDAAAVNPEWFMDDDFQRINGLENDRLRNWFVFLPFFDLASEEVAAEHLPEKQEVGQAAVPVGAAAAIPPVVLPPVGAAPAALGIAAKPPTPPEAAEEGEEAEPAWEKVAPMDYDAFANRFKLLQELAGQGSPIAAAFDKADAEKYKALGIGGEKRVFLAVDTQAKPRTLVAFAEYLEDVMPGSDEETWIIKEAEVTHNMAKRCDAIVPALAYAFQWNEDKTARRAFLVTPFQRGGSLDKLIAEKRAEKDVATRKFKVEVIKDWMTDLADAADCLHRKDYCHRDLKPGNILITENGRAKLCDFGMHGLGPEMDTIAGTPGYQPRELMLDEDTNYNVSVDVFSYGAVLFELFKLFPHYRADRAAFATDLEKFDEYYKKLVCLGVRPANWADAFGQETELKFLYKMCTKMFPHQRFTAADLVVHPALMAGEGTSVRRLNRSRVIWNKANEILFRVDCLSADTSAILPIAWNPPATPQQIQAAIDADVTLAALPASDKAALAAKIDGFVYISQREQELYADYTDASVQKWKSDLLKNKFFTYEKIVKEEIDDVSVRTDEPATLEDAKAALLIAKSAALPGIPGPSGASASGAGAGPIARGTYDVPKK